MGGQSGSANGSGSGSGRANGSGANGNGNAAGGRGRGMHTLFGAVLVARLLYPFFNSPLDHLFSDPQRHWDNAARFLHPGIMGSSDPYLYQLWLFAVRSLTHDSPPAIALACGFLCAAMPYGWYRALRELASRERALGGALLIGLTPESISLYGYFMNETLLLSLLGFCFWGTLRAVRKKTVGAYAAAAALWLSAAATRTIALPMAVGCLAGLWITQRRKPLKALVALAATLVVAIPAGLHAKAKLGFFSPAGNMYLNEIYSLSGARDIAVDYGPEGRYHFGCPSFYNPTFYPFSAWTTDRSGAVSVAINLTQGRAPWLLARVRAAEGRTFPRWRQGVEGALYALFGQSWPNSDRATAMGWLTLWTRWIWAPLLLWVAAAFLQRRFRGRAYILPACALGTALLLLFQQESVMEARYREPIDALLICCALLITPRRRLGSTPVAMRAASG